MSDRELTRDYYDATYGHCEGFLQTDPRTLNDTGSDARIDGVRSYTVQTFRSPEQGGDFCFVQIVEADKVTRVCLPPKVTALIAQQRAALSKRAMRAHGRMQAKRLPRPPKGVVPPQFARKTRSKKRS